MIGRIGGILRRRAGRLLTVPRHRRDLRGWQQRTAPVLEQLNGEARRGRRLMLIGLHQHMGDVVMATSVIRHLRRRHPDATLVFATQPRFRDIVAHHPGLDHIVECECIGSLVTLAADRVFESSHLLMLDGNRCELCGGIYHDAYAPFIARGIGAKEWFRHRRHLVELMFERLGLDDADPTPEIHVPEAIRARMRQRLRELAPRQSALRVALHTRTPHWPAKQWPAVRFSALMQRLQGELGAEIIVVGAEPVTGLPSPILNLTGQTSLLETAAVLAEIDLFIGLDSGPSHLASAVGTPTLLLFGPTDPALCRPLGSRVTILWHGGVDDDPFAFELRPGTTVNRTIARITVDEVMATVGRLVTPVA